MTPDGYRERLEGNFVLADHKRLQRAPGLVLSDRVQQQYPKLLCDFAQGVFTVSNPTPKPGLGALFRSTAARHGVRLRKLAADAWTGLRTFG